MTFGLLDLFSFISRVLTNPPYSSAAYSTGCSIPKIAWFGLLEQGHVNVTAAREPADGTIPSEVAPA